MAKKVVVAVKAEFDVYGQLTPISFCWENGVDYAITRVIDRRRAVSLKAGGGGMRYTCKVDGKLIYLFYDDTVWYLESG
ncbi:MAG: hypothetical protein ACYCYM_01640 [Saccharofermentanales bacterium]